LHHKAASPLIFCGGAILIRIPPFYMPTISALGFLFLHIPYPPNQFSDFLGGWFLFGVIALIGYVGVIVSLRAYLWMISKLEANYFKKKKKVYQWHL
jgi:hypothetical protein